MDRSQRPFSAGSVFVLILVVFVNFGLTNVNAYECGGTLSGSSGVFSWPHFHSIINCYWTIQVPPGDTVEVNFSNMYCGWSYIEVRRLSASGSSVPFGCVNGVPTQIRENISLWIHYHTTNSILLNGFTAHYTIREIDDCAVVTCLNGGQCVDGVNTFTCRCSPGYTGQLCDTDINECITANACEQTCFNVFGSYRCGCFPGYALDFGSINNQNCLPCHQGWWNSGNDTQRFEPCEPCPAGYATNTTTATSPDDCLLFCEPGQGVNGTSCVPCPQGWWNSGNDTQRYEPCNPCPDGFSTRTEAATSLDDCLLACGPGHGVNGSSCVPCPQGWWNSGNDTQRFEPCTPCPDGYTTTTTGADRMDQCVLACEPGQGFNGSSCVPCPQGWWNSGNGTQRFEPCNPCPDGYNTSTTGAASPEQCLLENCEKGMYLDTKNGRRCAPCPIGTYQSARGNSNCTACPSGSTTHNAGSTSGSQCFSPPGTETSVKMEMTYTLVVLCTDEQARLVGVHLQSRIVDLSANWNDLCVDKTCSNADVTASCPSSRDTAVAVLINMQHLPSVLSSNGSDVKVSPQSALMLSQSQLNLDVIGATLQRMSVTQSITCTDGYVKTNGKCEPRNTGEPGLSGATIGSIVGGAFGFIAVVLLTIVVCKIYRRNGLQSESNYRKSETSSSEHPYSGLHMQRIYRGSDRDHQEVYDYIPADYDDPNYVGPSAGYLHPVAPPYSASAAAFRPSLPDASSRPKLDTAVSAPLPTSGVTLGVDDVMLHHARGDIGVRDVTTGIYDDGTSWDPTSSSAGFRDVTSSAGFRDVTSSAGYRDAPRLPLKTSGENTALRFDADEVLRSSSPTPDEEFAMRRDAENHSSDESYEHVIVPDDVRIRCHDGISSLSPPPPAPPAPPLAHQTRTKVGYLNPAFDNSKHDHLTAAPMKDTKNDSRPITIKKNDMKFNNRKGADRQKEPQSNDRKQGNKKQQPPVAPKPTKPGFLRLRTVSGGGPYEPGFSVVGNDEDEIQTHPGELPSSYQARDGRQDHHSGGSLSQTERADLGGGVGRQRDLPSSYARDGRQDHHSGGSLSQTERADLVGRQREHTYREARQRFAQDPNPPPPGTEAYRSREKMDQKSAEEPPYSDGYSATTGALRPSGPEAYRSRERMDQTSPYSKGYSKVTTPSGMAVITGARKGTEINPAASSDHRERKVSAPSLPPSSSLSLPKERGGSLHRSFKSGSSYFVPPADYE